MYYQRTVAIYLGQFIYLQRRCKRLHGGGLWLIAPLGNLLIVDRYILIIKLTVRGPNREMRRGTYVGRCQTEFDLMHY